MVAKCGHDLRLLLRAVEDAHSGLKQLRAEPANRPGMDIARRRLRDALEAYAAAADAAGCPVPHRLRVQLNLYQCLDRNW